MNVPYKDSKTGLWSAADDPKTPIITGDKARKLLEEIDQAADARRAQALQRDDNASQCGR